MIIRLFCVLSVFVPFVDSFCTVGTSLQASCPEIAPNAVGNPVQSSSFTNFGLVSGFSNRKSRNDKTQTFLVSEEDVLEAVERAETLWAEALEARKTANALIDKAEEEANASAGTAEKAANIFQDKTTPVTMEELVQVDSAAKASLDATTLVNKAMEASDHARYEAAQMCYNRAMPISDEVIGVN